MVQMQEANGESSCGCMKVLSRQPVGVGGACAKGVTCRVDPNQANTVRSTTTSVSVSMIYYVFVLGSRKHTYSHTAAVARVQAPYATVLQLSLDPNLVASVSTVSQWMRFKKYYSTVCTVSK